jgi:hypothetical protein
VASSDCRLFGPLKKRVAGHRLKPEFGVKRGHNFVQRVNGSTKMRSINGYTGAVKILVYRVLMWKIDFSPDLNPECVLYWFYV